MPYNQKNAVWMIILKNIQKNAANFFKKSLFSSGKVWYIIYEVKIYTFRRVFYGKH